MRKFLAAGVAALMPLVGPAVAHAGISQTASSGCVATPSDTLSLTHAVGAGDDLVLLVSGDGYSGAAPVVTGVSDNINGAWSPLINDKSLATGDGVSNLSYSVWHFPNSKAAASGVKITIKENTGQTQASAVALDVAGPVAEDQTIFQTSVQGQSTALATPSSNAAANELAIGLFGPWSDGQSLSAGSGWTLNSRAENCSAALAESQTVAAAGSVTAKAVSGMSEYSLSGLMTFKPGTPSSGGSTTPAPTNTTAPAVAGTAQVGNTLTTTTGSWSGSPTAYTYAWEDCGSSGTVCSLISGATSSSYKIQTSDEGSTLRSLVTATNAGGSAAAQSAPTAAVPVPVVSAPAIQTAPAISGTAQQNSTLTVTKGSWTGSPTSYAYQWQHCTTTCSNISGATSASYVPQAADVGNTLDAVVTATNSGGTGSATSAQTAATTAAPVSTGGPSVTVTNTTGPTINTQLSTNNVWSGMLDQTPNGPTEFNALKAPYVRIHVGDDGYPAAMPEINKGQWSFSALDALVNDTFASGQKPLMNIKFAPDWMWSCYPKSIGVTNTQTAGSVVDQTFQTYAQYMARLVSYYNKGSMTTESGTVITNPAGTSHAITYWEPWNEPDLNNETPCAPSTGVGLTVSQYLTMWNAVTAAMLQVDPTIKFVGPATAGAQFGSSTTTGNQYVDTVMTSATTKPAAISFHGYGYWDNTVTDQWIFDGDNSDPTHHCCGGITDLVNGVKAIRASYPTTPVWLDEVNVNADWGTDTYARPWSAFAAAWWGAAFAQLAPLGAGMIHEYDAVDGPQFGMIDSTTGAPYISYYVTQLLDAAFPPGSTLLSSSSSDSGILSLAVRKPNGSMSVMIVNRKLASSTAHSACGTGGVAANVTVSLPSVPTAVSLQQLDSSSVNCSTGAAIAPTTKALSPSGTETVSLPGYGLAVLNIS